MISDNSMKEKENVNERIKIYLHAEVNSLIICRKIINSQGVQNSGVLFSPKKLYKMSEKAIQSPCNENPSTNNSLL